MVDCDTVVNPNTPNFFEMTDHKYSVLDNGCWEWTGKFEGIIKICLMVLRLREVCILMVDFRL